jgi:hypothetical protein
MSAFPFAPIGLDGYYYAPEAKAKPKPRKVSNPVEGIQNVRFELPFDGWCDRIECGVHLPKGLRINARKELMNMYFSTKVWRFKMECGACKGEIVIETEPAYKTYTYASGIRKQPERDDSSAPIMSNIAAPSQIHKGGANKAPAPVLNQRLLSLTREAAPKHQHLLAPSEADLEALTGLKHEDNVSNTALRALAMGASAAASSAKYKPPPKHYTKNYIPPGSKLQEAQDLMVANAVAAARLAASVKQTERVRKTTDTPSVPAVPAEPIVVGKMERVTRAKRRKLDAQEEQ